MKLDADVLADIEHLALVTYPRWWQRSLRASLRRCVELLCMRAAAHARHDAESRWRAEESVQRFTDLLRRRQQ